LYENKTLICFIFQVPVYWFAQYLGAFLAATLVFLIYSHSIDQAGGKTAATRAIFATYPNADVEQTSVTLAFDEMLGTALLVNLLCYLNFCK
jgi:glycerol uptake facilitator-like aquaporin